MTQRRNYTKPVTWIAVIAGCIALWVWIVRTLWVAAT